MGICFFAMLIVSAVTIEEGRAENVALESSRFTEEPICDVQTRLDEGCSRKVLNSRSLIQCLTLCLSDIECIGASLGPSNTCYHHDVVCSKVTGCTNVDAQHRYFARYCVRSHWDRATQACSCDNALYGIRCNAYPRDCRDLLSNGYSLGSYWTYVDPDGDGENPVRIYCYVKPSTGYNVVNIFKNTGHFDFNRTWAEYRDGFMYDEDNYWAGLRGWHAMSNYVCTRTVFIIYFNYSVKTNRFRRYGNLVMSDEDDKYTFTFSSSSRHTKGDLSPYSVFGECLDPLENVPFSTWDSDSDGVAEENCAGRNGNGWWYNGDCDNPCNALGWGFDFIDSKESYELMSILSIRFDHLFDKVMYTYLYLDCFY